MVSKEDFRVEDYKADGFERQPFASEGDIRNEGLRNAQNAIIVIL